MDKNDLLSGLAGAEKILVGIGEEFDDGRLEKNAGYTEGAEKLKEAGLYTFLPAWNDFCMERQEDVSVGKALEKLRELLEQKDYFVVSVSAVNGISRADWRPGRLVTPCGDTLRKQCEKGCEGVIGQIPIEERNRIEDAFERLYAGKPAGELRELMGTCPVCGGGMVFHNVYAESYNESGYLEQWQQYLKWLQGTVNKKLFVLELGVGMKFPTVIRWPFEKAAYFNQKAFFCRVNKDLYQLTEELAGKGVGISQNAIEWLCGL